MIRFLLRIDHWRRWNIPESGNTNILELIFDWFHLSANSQYVNLLLLINGNTKQTEPRGSREDLCFS